MVTLLDANVNKINVNLVTETIETTKKSFRHRTASKNDIDRTPKLSPTNSGGGWVGRGYKLTDNAVKLGVITMKIALTIIQIKNLYINQLIIW